MNNGLGGGSDGYAWLGTESGGPGARTPEYLVSGRKRLLRFSSHSPLGGAVVGGGGGKQALHMPGSQGKLIILDSKVHLPSVGFPPSRAVVCMFS